MAIPALNDNLRWRQRAEKCAPLPKTCATRRPRHDCYGSLAITMSLQSGPNSVHGVNPPLANRVLQIAF
jgi:hypothetical protein